jgi:hypothetical protein
MYKGHSGQVNYRADETGTFLSTKRFQQMFEAAETIGFQEYDAAFVPGDKAHHATKKLVSRYPLIFHFFPHFFPVFHF